MSDFESCRTKANYWLLPSAVLPLLVVFWQWRTLLLTDIWTKPILVPLGAVALLLAFGALAWFLGKTLLFQRVVVDEGGVEFVDLLGNRKISVPFHNIKLVRFYESDQGKGGRFQIVSITVATNNRKGTTKRFGLFFLGTSQTSRLRELLLTQVSETWNTIVSADSTRLSNPNFTSSLSDEHGRYPQRLIYWIYDLLFAGLVLLPLWFWR